MQKHGAVLTDKGTYILAFKTQSLRRMVIGRLGEYEFKKGAYFYVGSAFGNGGLKARIRHHVNRTPSPRWHIDYFKEHAVLKEIICISVADHLEHFWAATLMRMDEFEPVVRGFGASDCKCPTHLFFNGHQGLMDLVERLEMRLATEVPATRILRKEWPRLFK